MHFSTRDSASRRPCPSCAAAAPSKPYSRPNVSHASKTPGVESISVLKGREIRGYQDTSVECASLMIAAPIHVKENLLNEDNARGASANKRLELRG